MDSKDNKSTEKSNDLKTDELIAKLEQEKNYVESYDPRINLKYPKINLQKNDDISNLLGKRVELNEKTATIKYVGPLKHKKDAKETEIWLGLEWDDKSRGKHNGTVENYEYFKTLNNEKSGSLIKMTKVNIGQTFKGALGYKYNFYEEEGNDLANILPKLKELSLTRTLLTKWSDLLSLLLQFKNLNLLNFSENILIFDDLFEEQIQKFISGEYKQHLNTLVLNNCNLDVYHLVKLSPLFTQLDYLYLKDNKINPETYEKSENKKYIDDNISNIEKYTPNLKYLSLEHNKINIFFFGYKIFKSPKLKYINMNQNLISELISKNNIDEDKKLLELFKKSMTHISLDYNMFKKEDYTQIMLDLESMELKDIDILNNGFIDKIGVSKVKIEMIGRNPQLTILNNTTITKIMRRDAEKQYLIELVKEYINSLGNKAFDKFVFEKYMEKYHRQYFNLKKKFFDPLDDYENLTRKNNTNTMKSNMCEIVLQYGDKTINKKFPKSIVFTNLKNLCVKLFKIDGDSLLSFYLKNGDKEELVEDETVSLQSLNLPPKQIILIKNK